MLQCLRASMNHIGSRAIQQNGALVIGISFQDRDHKYKAFQRFEPNNRTQLVVDWSVIIFFPVIDFRPGHSNGVFDDRAATPRLRKVFEDGVHFKAIVKRCNETPLRALFIACQQERE